MKKVKPEHPPLRAFALELLAKGPVGPHGLKNAWFEHKKATGQTYRKHLPCASRDDFGNTSAAYQCLYKLEKMGLVKAVRVDRWTTDYELVNPKTPASHG